MRASVVAAALLVLVRPSWAQDPVPIAHSYRFASRILSETRVIDVSLPRDYDARAGQRFPVIVVLDGEFNHEVAAAIGRFYATLGQIPPVITVGVRNTDRNRDMTPAAVAGFDLPPEAPTAGGADRFLAFLADELLPYLDSTYRTTPMRVLVGHSLGGLFALHALGQRPDVFMGYVVLEPSIWWNNEREFAQARAVLKTPAARRARVMMVNARGFGLDTTQWGGAKPMLRHMSTTGETHGSMVMPGVMYALKTMFQDFKPAEWRPGMRPVQMLDRYDSLAARVGYVPPISEEAFALAIRMAIDARHFTDAAAALDRMERALGVTQRSRDLRAKLARDRVAPVPEGFVPLDVPARRPTVAEAKPFLGRWVTDGHEVEIRASGDTIVVHDRIKQGHGGWYEADDPVVQVTPDGTLEWGLPWFRGLAALVVLQGRVQRDGTLLVTREPRGWVPRQGGPEMTRTQRFRRAP